MNSSDTVESIARRLSPVAWEWHDRGLDYLPVNIENSWLYSLNRASDIYSRQSLSNGGDDE